MILQLNKLRKEERLKEWKKEKVRENGNVNERKERQRRGTEDVKKTNKKNGLKQRAVGENSEE